MAEAASSAIGIISFGLTACKGLYEYYHAYRSFDSSISSAFESIAQVASTLVLLKDSFHDPGLDRERRDKVEACVSDCEGVLTRLNEKLQDLKTNDPKGFRGKAKAQFQRHAFPFKEQSLKELRNSADEAQSRLAFALQILELTERLKSQRVLDHLATWSNGVSVTIDEISDNTKELLSFARSEEIDKIKNWLSPPDPWTNHNAARCLHQAETGKWVLENDAYKAWLGGSSRNLWLHGKAGCGKTILSSTMVENVLHHCRQAVNFGCAPFYFTFSDKGKQTYEALLRSLLHQLGNQEPGLAIIRKKYGQRHDLRGGLSIEILQSWLLDVLAVYDTTFVVLDALDECPEDSGYLSERSKLFDGLEYLSKEAANLKINLKILMTSRDVPDIRHRVVDLPAEQLPIHAPAVDSDISRYVAEQLSKVTYFKNLQPKSRHEIQSTITAKADGMFRWAFCQLLELSKNDSTRPTRVTKMLKELPPTLDATYTRMLERIGPAVSEDALTLLRWLAYAARPVTLAELQTAVTISPEDDEVDFEDEGDFRDSLRILAGLIVFSNGADSKKDGGDAEHDKASLETKDLTPGAHVRLAHFSVKEYLESARISRSPASFFRLEAGACHRFLARSCLTYLMSYSKSGEKTSRELDLDKFHLLNYAADKWHEHSRLQSGDDVSREVALLECKNAMIDWLEVDSFQFNGVHLSVYNVPRMPSICYAVYLHLPRVVKKLLEAGQNANAVGPYYKPLLVVATENEDQTTVELLLAHGADVDMAPENQSGNALWCAASRGLLLTELMVNNGANVNFDGFSGTALSAACKANDQSVVHFLLERGARIDTAALRGASSHGHTEMVKLLVAKGANVNDLSTHTTSLMAAAESGHIGVMEVLIDAGADVNAKDSGALLGALLCGHEHAVALLEAKGAYELTSKRLDQALFETCYERSCRAFYTHREKAIDLLLDRGANANGGALSFALERGDEHVVGLLEARGAKLTLESLNYILTATFHVYQLQRRHHQCEAVLNLSLDRGADINAMDSSVLLAALESGQDDMVALLEAKGAKKPTLEQLGKSLISVCDDHRHHCPSRAVELLLDRGADVSAEDSSALLGALWSGQENLAALLEAKGAKKPTLEQLGKSLISVCDDQYHRCPNIAVGLLLDRGADVSAKDSSALLDAMRSGQEDTVALLEAKGANKPTLEQLKAALIEVRGKLYHRNLDNAVQMLLDRGADGNTADSNFQDLPDSVA